MSFALVFAASLVAVLALVGLAAWARIAAPTPPLDEAAARAVLAEEFPGDTVSALWLASDGTGAVARAGDKALVLVRVGDAYAARRLPWSAARDATIIDGRLVLPGADAATPRLRLALAAAWPPPETAA